MRTIGALGTETMNPQWNGLDCMETADIVELMATENQRMMSCILDEKDGIAAVIDAISRRYNAGGRIIYMGAGTSGRLGVIDAAECPPTFGVDPERIKGVIAGGYGAMVSAVEGIEDSVEQGANDLIQLMPRQEDVVIGVSASGRTPYCIGALRYGRSVGALTVAVCNNIDSEMGAEAEMKIELETGPEIIVGSTRLKAASAQKIVLNMISSITMIRAGNVYKNLMVEMKATNNKLADRAARIFMEATGAEDRARAEDVLSAAKGDLKTAIVMELCRVNAEVAEKALVSAGRNVHKAIAQLL